MIDANPEEPGLTKGNAQMKTANAQVQKCRVVKALTRPHMQYDGSEEEI
jgi:hypothetical protein